jgi:hypothetical protein
VIRSLQRLHPMLGRNRFLAYHADLRCSRGALSPRSQSYFVFFDFDFFDDSEDLPAFSKSFSNSIYSGDFA